MLDRRDVLRGLAAGAVIGCLPAKPTMPDRRTPAFAHLGTLRLALAGAAITGGSFSGPRLRGKVLAGGVSSRVRHTVSYPRWWASITAFANASGAS